MKLLHRLCAASLVSLGLAIPAARAGDCPALLDHRIPGLLDEKPTSLCAYAGKVLLVVNTASRCAFTPQYEGLERLQRQLGDRGLVVLGFPANDFGGQEPGSNRQVADFCATTYGVSFPLFAKTRVVGSDAHPLFVELGRLGGQAPQWNFHKYLIDRSATRVVSFGSRVGPDDPRLRARIDAFLSEKP